MNSQHPAAKLEDGQHPDAMLEDGQHPAAVGTIVQENANLGV
jgi:hypothetical protein